MTEQAAGVRACPYCAEEIKAAAVICRHCGKDVRVKPPAVKRRTHWWVWPIGAAGLWVIWSQIKPSGEEWEAKGKARQTIETCWAEQERKSLDPATARFVASTCEKLEQDFAARFGHSP